MQSQAKSVKILPVDRDSEGNIYLVCPICHRNRRVKRIAPDEDGTRIVCFCRDCKNEFRIDIHEGQCFESRSQ